MAARVEILSREKCHLCDDAIALVSELCAELGESFTVTDVDGDPSLKERYGDEVPVVLVDANVVGFWRIDPQALRSALVA